MRFGRTGLLLLGALTTAASAAAQTTPTPSAITRTVVAAAKLPTVTDVPLYFRAVAVTLEPGQTSGAAAVNGILYQISGVDRRLGRRRSQNTQRRRRGVHR